jgi:putative aldouronate transport system permease protein
VIFLPYFISWVIVGTFVFNILNFETGALNNLLRSLGQEPVNVYEKPLAWPFIICAFNAWKWCGYNSVIYIAAITAIDGECFEAADIDGANIFQKIRYITFPSIRPTIITMLLLQVGRILRGDFEMFYQIVGNSGQLFNATDVIDTYVFRSLMTSVNIGMTAAASLYQSLLCFIIIMTVNYLVKKAEAEYALF